MSSCILWIKLLPISVEGCISVDFKSIHKPYQIFFSLEAFLHFRELSVLSICMIDETKDVTGFMALDDHPNVPSVDEADWEYWMRNMFQLV